MASTLPPVSLSQTFWPIFLATSADNTSCGTATSFAAPRDGAASGFCMVGSGLGAVSDGPASSGFEPISPGDGAAVPSPDVFGSGSRTAVAGSGRFGGDSGAPSRPTGCLS
jgi:hypothetical protein